MKKTSILAICLLILISGCGKKNEVIKPNNNNQEVTINQKKEPIISKLSLAMVGDMLIHSAVYADARTKDGYDFNNMLKLVKPLISKYDLAFYNQESILGGIELGLSSYPRFNSPFSVGDIMVDMGFNLVALANNHTLDRGEQAIINSTTYWANQQDVLASGSYSSQENRDKINIKTKNDITYALLSYTTLTNGLKVPAGKDYLVNVYNEEIVKQDVEKIRNQVDVLMVSMHWGSEYTNTPTSSQQEQAAYLASLGVDIIIGHHPHVIQPIDFIEDTLVIYSLGNFFSGQVGLDKNVGLLASVDIIKKTIDDTSTISFENINTNLVYTDYVGYEKDGVWYCHDYKLYPFENINDDVLNDYLNIKNKYNTIITRYSSNMPTAIITN